MAQVLPPFEGKTVHKATLKITKAGDGLSEALELEPQALHVGDRVCYVVRAKVRQVNHRENTEDKLTRQHTVEVTGIAPVDESVADEIINAQTERLTKLRDERDGQGRIDV